MFQIYGVGLAGDTNLDLRLSTAMGCHDAIINFEGIIVPLTVLVLPLQL
jgi:hypothetical protein